VAGLLALGLGAPAALADTSPPVTVPPTPATVSADVLPTWQINGVVYSQVTIGNTVYAAGQFSQARPPGVAVGGAGSVTANNLFAYNITTGNPVPGFKLGTNGAVHTITASPDGTTVYIGGDFTQTYTGVAWIPRNRMAAISTGTNAFTTFATSFDARVGAIAVSKDNLTVYVGGQFTLAGGQHRAYLAAYSNAGALSPSWKPATDGQVQSMVVTPAGDRVIVGGQFYALNGTAVYGMGAVSASTGVIQRWDANKVIKVTNKIGATVYRNGAIDSLRTDGTHIFGAAWSNGKGAQFEGTFGADPTTGAIYFVNNCHGDSYDVAPVGGVLYVASHSHSCQAIGGFPNSRSQYHATAFTTFPTGTNGKDTEDGWPYQGQPSSTLLDWFPLFQPGTFTKEHQATWSVTASGDGNYVAYGGEFPLVNGIAQQGLVRFAVSSLAPNKVGPTPTSVLPPTASSSTSGTAQVTWTTAWDKDNTRLTYAVYRYTTDPTPVVTKIASGLTQDSTFWRLSSMSHTDTGLTPGHLYRYQIQVTDPFGNTIWSSISSPVKISSGPGTVNSTFTPAGPCRVFDTRTGGGNCSGSPAVPKRALGAGQTLTVKVAGVAGVPTNATAVVVNLTAVGATRPTWLTAWPSGTARPTASNLNVSNANATPNLAIVPVGAGGAISLYNAAGSVNVLADLSGYLAPQSGATLTALTPCRVFDTRVGTGACAGAPTVPKSPIGAGKTLSVKVTGTAGVPANATAVVVNLTAVGATTPTWVGAFPTGSPRPTASNLNLSGPAATPNLAIVPVGAGGSISFYNAAGSVNLLADISGYFGPTVVTNSAWFAATGPCRAFDTRSGSGNCAGAVPTARGPVGAGVSLPVRVTVGGVASTATAVVVNLTAVSATAPTWVAAWPSGHPRPTVSNLNVNNADAVPNLALVPVGTAGSIDLYNAAGRVQLLGDISGYFTP
jgi:hypothetical protein